MDRIYIMTVIKDLKGKPCIELGTGGIFWVDNRLSTANKALIGREIISAYQKQKPHVIGFILSTYRSKPDYVNSFYAVENKGVTDARCISSSK